MPIRTSESIAELSDAFVKAQAKFTSAIKDAQNPQYRSKYADLSSVISAMLPHLVSEGLSLMQHPSLEWRKDAAGDDVAYVTVTTRLQHKSGQFMESDLMAPAVQRDRFDAQSIGSAITYLCRYGAQSIGFLAREDDDAQKAVGAGTREEAQAVGKSKVEALKASKAQQDPSVGPPQLCYYIGGTDLFEVTGMPDVMEQHKELLLAYGKRTKEIDKATGKPKPIMIMTGEGFEAFKFEFCDNRKGILVRVPGIKAAEAAKVLKEAM